MRTITTTVYQFDELNDKAKQKAIENIREDYYRYNDFNDYVIDDCYLLEPRDTFEDFQILIKNNRKVYYSLDRNRYIDISHAMEIQDDRTFLKWLGLDDDLVDRVGYNIRPDSIYIFNQSANELKEDEIKIIDAAEYKFKEHCKDILNCIERSIEYCFSDESITEDIFANDLEFTEDGERV
jgi:hypothetical protein